AQGDRQPGRALREGPRSAGSLPALPAEREGRTYFALLASARSVAAIFSYMAACSSKVLTRLAQCWGMALAPVPFPELLLYDCAICWCAAACSLAAAASLSYMAASAS